MQSLEKLMERMGYVKLDRYGLVRTPDDRIMSLRPTVLDNGGGEKIVGWHDDDLAAMELDPWQPRDRRAEPRKLDPRPPLPPALPRPLTRRAASMHDTQPMPLAQTPPPMPWAPPTPPEPPPAAAAARLEAPSEEEDWEWQIVMARAQAAAATVEVAAMSPVPQPVRRSSPQPIARIALQPAAARSTVIPIPSVPSITARQLETIAPVRTTRRLAQGTQPPANSEQPADARQLTRARR